MRVKSLTVLLQLFAATVAVADWPQFRGPTGDGRAPLADLPITWSEDDNVTWKVPLPGRGWSSPVAWGSEIWLTAARDEERSLRALKIDAASGELLLDVEVFRPQKWQHKHPDNSYASPTPVIEEGRLYVHFGSYGTACLATADGRPLWQSHELNLDGVATDHEHGPGSSPIVHGRLLIVNCDGADRRFVAALDKDTGQLVWTTPRSAPSSTHNQAFSTPLVVTYAGRDELISPGAGQVNALDPRTGEELWSVRYEGYSNVPRPVAGLGMAFVNTGYMKPHLLALRLGGRGDVTDSHVVWSYHWQVSANPSPLLIGDRLFFVSDQGIATWLDARRGEDLWRQRLRAVQRSARFRASPLYARGRIYTFSVEGRSWVIAAGDTYRELAVNELAGAIRASPAVADDALIVRTESHLYRIDKSAEP